MITAVNLQQVANSSLRSPFLFLFPSLFWFSFLFSRFPSFIFIPPSIGDNVGLKRYQLIFISPNTSRQNKRIWINLVLTRFMTRQEYKLCLRNITYIFSAGHNTAHEYAQLPSRVSESSKLINSQTTPRLASTPMALTVSHKLTSSNFPGAHTVT